MSRAKSSSSSLTRQTLSATGNMRIETAFGAPLVPRKRSRAKEWLPKPTPILHPPLVRAAAPTGEQRGVLLVDLFACVGGFSTGASQSGHTVALAVDCDPVALAVHEANHPACRHHEMTLGPDTEEELVALIREVVPEGTHWHLHGSPPCTKLSFTQRLHRRSGVEYDTEAVEASAREGADLVEWYLAFAKRMRPTSWSMEQVNAKLVTAVCDERKRLDPAWFDYSVVQFWLFGVPQSRTRVIAGLPWMVERLRFDQWMRSPMTVAVREVLTPPDDAVYMRNCCSRAADQSLTEEGADGEFLNDDAESRSRGVDEVGFTMMAGKALQWWDKQYRCVRDINVSEMVALQTFPSDYVFPTSVKIAERISGVGNAVPPLFAQKFMSRYRIP